MLHKMNTLNQHKTQVNFQSLHISIDLFLNSFLKETEKIRIQEFLTISIKCVHTSLIKGMSSESLIKSSSSFLETCAHSQKSETCKMKRKAEGEQKRKKWRQQQESRKHIRTQARKGNGNKKIPEMKRIWYVFDSKHNFVRDEAFAKRERKSAHFFSWAGSSHHSSFIHFPTTKKTEFF